MNQHICTCPAERKLLENGHDEACPRSYEWRKAGASRHILSASDGDVTTFRVVGRAIDLARTGAFAKCLNRSGVMSDPILDALEDALFIHLYDIKIVDGNGS